jgi:hypothetical protein
MALGTSRRVGTALVLAGVMTSLVVAIGIGPAHAANVVVTSGVDSGPGTLRNAVAAAAPGDVITFTVATVTLTTASITINKNLVIRGNGPQFTTITRSGNVAFRIFDVTAGTVTIDMVTISGGAGPSGGGIRNNGTLTLTRSTVTANNVTAEGGGILNRAGATATIRNSEIRSNSVQGSAAGRGGGIANAGTLTVSNSAVGPNAVQSGPFAGGAGIANLAGGTLTVAYTDVQGNQAVSTSGGQAAGGGILHESATTLSVTDSRVRANSVNGSPSQGGGLAVAGPADVTRVEVSGNTASGPGNRLGGGIHLSAGVTVTNATLAGNSGSHGGGLFKGGLGAATLANSTVAANTTTVGGAVQEDGAGTLTVQSAIVANQSSGVNCAGTITNGGNNLQFGDAGTCPGFTVADPVLGPLAFNGGVSQTMPISAGSAAIDAGSCATAPTDQRRFPRVGPCDIGAFEFNSVPADATPPTCGVAGVLATNPKQMDVFFEDTVRGVQAITNVSVTNGYVVVPFFLPSSPLRTVLAAVKTNQAQPTSFSFDAVDQAGNVRHCA